MKKRVIHYLMTTYYLGVAIILINIDGAIRPAFDSEFWRLGSCSSMACGFYVLYKTYRFRQWLKKEREEAEAFIDYAKKSEAFIKAAIEEADGDPIKFQEILKANGFRQMSGNRVEESTPDKREDVQ